MALLEFIFSSLLSLPERVALWLRIIPVHVRERERGKKKEEEEKSPEKTLFPTTKVTYECSFHPYLVERQSATKACS